MKEKVRFLGLDVHAETIAVAIAEPDGAVRSLGAIPNRMESIRKMVKSWPDGLRSLLAVGRAGSRVRGDRADAGSDEGWRPGEDGPPGCREAGARGGQAGPVAGASPAE